MANGPQTEWYLNLNKAHWTPPGWVFGAAWTTIMICFSIYLSYLFGNIKDVLFCACIGCCLPVKCELELCVLQSAFDKLGTYGDHPVADCDTLLFFSIPV